MVFTRSDGTVQILAGTWDGQRLRCYDTMLGEATRDLPRVERRPFAVSPSGTENPHYDLIVRKIDAQNTTEVPLGIVSKRYRLVQHAELLDGVIAGLRAVSLPEYETLPTEVRITELGSRLYATIHLPEQFRVPIGVDTLDLTIECLNSVERSSAFRVGMGWIRIVCGNGLFAGRVKASMLHAHVGSLRVEMVPQLIATGFDAAALDAARWQHRASLVVRQATVDQWADDTVTKRWGVVAAARTIHISRTGYDGYLADKERGSASQRRMINTVSVPGSEPPNDNVFRIGQVLAWVANGSTEMGTRLERRRQVPELLAPLVRRAKQVRSQARHRQAVPL